STSYPGASAETIQKSVIVPLEEAINGVENMNYITSSATNTGSATITVYFKQGVDPDMAAVNVQNRVARATGNLPSAVNQIGVTVNKRQTSMLKIFSLYSPDSSYNETFLANYLMINVIPEVLRIGGVGDAMVLGANYSMRIWLKPDVMAQYGLIPSDISAVLAEQNIEAATGSFGENSNETYQYTMKYKGRLLTPEEFGEMVVRSTADGEVLKIKDIATVELGSESYNFIGQTDGCPGITAMVYQTAGSNATKVVQDIDKLLDEIRPTLPKGTAIVSIMSVTDFLYASIHEVLKTLFEAIILVIIVVYIFLQDLKSTLIPLVGIIVSLIGTFAFMMLLGFSINLITLFALVLVIGTVVDDSIVVVEAVQSKFDEGYRSPYKASVDAMKGISAAVVTSSLVFMAVFIPVSFMGGTSGTFYTQFGLTMAVAVGISAVNALTLSPALCALLLRPYTDESGEEKDNFASRFRHAFNAVFGRLSNKYKEFVLVFIRRRWIPWAMLGGTAVLLVFLMSTIQTSLVPEEDQGTVFVNVTMPAGYSLNSTAKVMDEIETDIRTIPQIRDYTKVSGFGLISGQGVSYGMFIIKLKPWDDRPRKSDNVNSVIKEIYKRTAGIPEATIFAMAPGMIPGYGMGNSLEINVQDRVGGDVTELYNVTQNFIAGLRASPVFQ
ncbi:MAG: efflux RND transporter permease subunit, partial [Bacteroidales bacterium]|nr:efflux RND transporter permease subunit [Bacteroidales bacterium]